MGDAKKVQAPVGSEIRRPEAGVGRDPYSFQSGGIKVRVRFSGGRTIEEAVSHYLAMRDNADSAMGAK